MEKPKTVKKPNTKISASRAYELSDSLRKTGQTNPITIKQGFDPSVQRQRTADRDKSIRLKTRADEAVKKAGGVRADYRIDGHRYDRSLDRSSIDNKAVGRDMPLPESSQLFDA